MYHPHHDEMTQMALGMTGMIVIHPRVPAVPRVDRDFVLLLHEWRINPGARRPDPNEMVEFNMLTINGHAFPGTEALVAKTVDPDQPPRRAFVLGAGPGGLCAAVHLRLGDHHVVATLPLAVP